MIWLPDGDKKYDDTFSHFDINRHMTERRLATAQSTPCIYNRVVKIVKHISIAILWAKLADC